MRDLQDAAAQRPIFRKSEGEVLIEPLLRSNGVVLGLERSIVKHGGWGPQRGIVAVVVARVKRDGDGDLLKRARTFLYGRSAER